MADIAKRLYDAMITEKVLNKIGLAAVRIIVKRTRRQSLDVSGKSLQPYSAKYLAKRAGDGLASPAKVTMSFARTNSMLDTIDLRAAENYVELYFNDPLKEKLAYYHNISGAGKSRVIRRFWGIEIEQEKENLTQLAQKEAERTLTEAVGVILKQLYVEGES